MIVIDFDGVLLDDIRFKRDYLKMFREFGIPVEAYERAYQKIKKENGGWYTPDLHIRVLKKRFPEIDAGILKKQALLFATHAADYIYTDAKKFLSYAKSIKEEMVLLTSGPEFQRRKVEESGLRSYFSEIKIIKQSSKLSSVRRLLKAKQVRLIFLDDKADIIDEIKRSEPSVWTIQIKRRPDQPQSLYADSVAGNLQEAEKILKKKLT